MVNQQLLDYIKQQTQVGVSKENIKTALLGIGWQAADIEETFGASGSVSTMAAPQAVAPQVVSARPAGKFKKILVAIGIVIGGLLIVGGGAWAYLNYFLSPEKNMQKMVTNLFDMDIKALEYSGEIKAEVKTGGLLDGGEDFLQMAQLDANKETSNFVINLSGAFDILDTNNTKGWFAMVVNTDALGAEALPGETLAVGFEVRNVDKAIYAKLSEVPVLGMFDFSSLKDQWIKIDLNEVGSQAGLGKTGEQIQKLQSGQGLSAEQTDKLKALVQRSGSIKVIEKLPGGQIDGMEMYHYKFMFDKEAVKDLLIEAERIVQGKTWTAEESADFDKSFEGIELYNAEIWIGKKDLLPYKLILSGILKETDKSKISGKLDLILTVKNYNQPAQIEVPTGAITLGEIIGGLFGIPRDTTSMGDLPGGDGLLD